MSNQQPKPKPKNHYCATCSSAKGRMITGFNSAHFQAGRPAPVPIHYFLLAIIFILSTLCTCYPNSFFHFSAGTKMLSNVFLALTTRSKLKSLKNKPRILQRGEIKKNARRRLVITKPRNAKIRRAAPVKFSREKNARWRRSATCVSLWRSKNSVWDNLD